MIEFKESFVSKLQKPMLDGFRHTIVSVSGYTFLLKQLDAMVMY
jgi:hypothetical protein